MVRILHQEPEGKSLKGMKEEYRDARVKMNKNFFAEKFVSGIHKEELPKFATAKKPFWSPGSPKAKNGETSFRKLWQERKFWAKTDGMFCNEIECNDTMPEPDEFKKTFVKQVKKDGVSDKPNLLNTQPLTIE
jgi:hypothetical protein